MHGGPACMVCRRSGIVGSAGGMPSDAVCVAFIQLVCEWRVCAVRVCVCVGSRTGAQLVLLRMDPGVWSVDVLALATGTCAVWPSPKPNALLSWGCYRPLGGTQRVTAREIA